MRVKKMITWRNFGCACILLIAGSAFGQHLTMTNVAGNGELDYTGPGDPLMTGMQSPSVITTDGNGNIYFAVSALIGSGIFKIDVESNTISRLVENTGSLTGMAVSEDGTIYFSFGAFGTYDYEYIYKRDPLSGDIVTIAGNGDNLEAPDEPDGVDASTNPIGNAGGLKLHGAFLYYSAVLENYNYIQKINLSNGLTYRVAGIGGPAGADLDGGADRLTSYLSLDLGLAWDSDDNLYFPTADRRIKMINFSGDDGIYHVAGNGTEDYDASESVSSNAGLGIKTSGILITPNDELIFCDAINKYIRKIKLIDGSGNVGETIETIAGTGYVEDDVDAISEHNLYNFNFNDPIEANIEPKDIMQIGDDLYFTDQGAQRIRRIYTCENPEYVDPVISKDIICAGDSVKLSYTATQNDGSIWYWYEDDCGENVITGANTAELTILVTEDKTYYARGEGGCSNTTACLEFKLEVDCADYFNAFTPNGDGKNDFLEIPLLDSYATNTVIIYNRWGQLLEQIENYDNLNSVWNGTNGNNDPIESGTYYFTAEADGALILSGWVQVIK